MSAPDHRYANLKVEPEIRDRIRRQKRGGQTYSDVLEAMLDQYSPPEPPENE